MSIQHFATRFTTAAFTARHHTLTYDWSRVCTFLRTTPEALTRQTRLALIEALWDCDTVCVVDWDEQSLTIRVLP